MPKIIITADIHNGVPGKIKDCIWSLDIIRQYADKHKIKDVFVCGDMFHDRVSLGIDILNAVYDQLKLNIKSGQEWHVFVGNHDMFLKNSWDTNSLHIFGDVAKLYEKIERIELYGHGIHILPFIHYESKYMEELASIEKVREPDDDILLTHVGVCNASLNECFLIKNWSIVTFEQSKFDYVFTGHFHCQQKVGRNVWYPGSPIPFRFDEGLVDHGFLVFDLDSKEVEFVKIFDICGEFSEYRPADYLTLTKEDAVKHLESLRGNHVRVQLTEDHTTNELAALRKQLTDGGVLSVHWMIKKKEIDEVAALHSQLTGVGKPEATFNSWLEKDKPEGYNLELLRQINKQVMDEAEERIVVEEDTTEE